MQGGGSDEPPSNSMKQTEHLHQVAVFQTLALYEKRHPHLKWIYAVANGGHRHPAVASKLKAEGVRRGIADICIPFASKSGSYPGAYIEMKSPKGKVSVEQAEFLEFVRSQGYAVEIAYSCDEALRFIADYTGVKIK